jgi:transposase-like protein
MKAKNVPADRKAEPIGDMWTWTALDADTKLVPSWLVGSRDSGTAYAFIQDIAERLATRVQMTTDGHKVYLEAIEAAFGADIDYSMLIKTVWRGTDRRSPLQPREVHRDADGVLLRESESRARQHVLRRAPEPDHENEHAPLHEAHERLFKEG